MIGGGLRECWGVRERERVLGRNGDDEGRQRLLGRKGENYGRGRIKTNQGKIGKRCDTDGERKKVMESEGEECRRRRDRLVWSEKEIKGE